MTDKKPTKEDIKESIIEKNYEILNNFDNKNIVRILRGEINDLLDQYLTDERWAQKA